MIALPREGDGVVLRPPLRRLQDLDGRNWGGPGARTLLWTPEASTSHYILLAAIAEAAIDNDRYTVETGVTPAMIMRAWDAGTIDGAACWGACLYHLQTQPYAGRPSDLAVPGLRKTIADASTVQRWGYFPFTIIAANDDFLATRKADVDRVVAQRAPVRKSTRRTRHAHRLYATGARAPTGTTTRPGARASGARTASTRGSSAAGRSWAGATRPPRTAACPSRSTRRCGRSSASLRNRTTTSPSWTRRSCSSTARSSPTTP